jgi:putative DNA primase/helicase
LIAQEFLEHDQDFRYVPPWGRWLHWDGMRWADDASALILDRIRDFVRPRVSGSKAERTTANSSFVAGVARLCAADQRVVIMPSALDADPWALNTHSGIVDLRTGAIRDHDRAALCTRLTGCAIDPSEGNELWDSFLVDVTVGDLEMMEYLQRVAGYFASGMTSEDVLVYIIGIGANGKGTFAEACIHVLGDYGKVFSPEVLMEAKGERHPTEIAQLQGVRFALTSEPASNAVWNDSRIKSLTGDTVINARVMRGDPFTFARTHKTMVIGNHMPRLAEVTNAIKRRVQIVPFRAVFTPGPGIGMRERLKAEAGGAILAWIIAGARKWLESGTAPPEVVREQTRSYLSDQDLIGQWMDECLTREKDASARSADLHRSYSAWCDANGNRPKSNLKLTEHLVSLGVEKRQTMVGRVFYGLRIK